MISAEQARAIAEPKVYAGVPAEARLGVELWEFEHGWVAWRTRHRADPSRPDPNPGGSAIVVERADGSVHYYPTIAPSEIAAQHTARRAAEGRFPAEVVTQLYAAGWFPGRRIGTLVDQFADYIHRTWYWPEEERWQRVEIFPAAHAVLDEFGGLTISPVPGSSHATTGWVVETYPSKARVPSSIIVGGMLDELDQPVYPIGGHGPGKDRSEIVLAEDGRTFRCGEDHQYLIGQTLIEAITTLVSGEVTQWVPFEIS